MMLRSLIALALLTFPAYGGYARRATVTFPGATTSTQTNITLAFSFSDATFATVANGGAIQNATCTHVVANLPCDFIVTDDSTCATLTGSYTWGFDGDYSAAAGTGHVWVLIPSHTTSPKAVSICYGNAAVNTYQGGAAGAEFDANTKAAYHLPDGSTLSVKDFSSNAKDGTNSGTTAATGFIDGGLDSTGDASVLVTLPGSIFSSNVLTISGWARVTAVNAFQALFSIDTSNSDSIEVFINGSGSQLFGGNFPDAAFSAISSISANTWFHFSLTSSGTVTALYVNGAASGTTGTTNFSTFTAPTLLANRSNLQFPMTGQLDEVTISSSARSADWIATEYANQLSPPAAGSFTPVGSSGFPVVY